MNHKELTIKASKWLKKHSNNAQVSNCPTIAIDMVSLNSTGEVPDVIGWSYSYSVLIEVKVSRSDFLADKKKKFRVHSELGMGQMRFYCCTENMIKEDELPEGWGLLYLVGKRIVFIKQSDKFKANVSEERVMLLSIIRRLLK